MNNINIELVDNLTADEESSSKRKNSLHREFFILEKDSIKNDCIVLKEKFKEKIKGLKNRITKKSFFKSLAISHLPIIRWLFLEYKIKTYLISDIIAGLTVGVMNLPQSMAYSLLANLPPVNGLYISFFPLLMYTIFGTSKHLAIGAIAIISLLSGQVIQSVADDYKQTLSSNQTNVTDKAITQYKITVACSLAFLVGVVQLIMGFTGLGIITTYFSDSFISGYTSGSAIHVLTSQLKDLFGIKNVAKYNGLFKIPKTIFDIIIKLPMSNIGTVISSALCIIYLVIFKEFVNPRIKKRIKIEFPTELLLVIFITAISYFAKFDSKLGISTVKEIPKGLPSQKLPNIFLWPGLVKDAILIGVIAFSISISLGTIFSRKHKYKIDSTQELYAYGISNIFGSFFSCFPSAASLARSTVLESSGGKTQIASLCSSIIILFVILWIGPLLEPLPKACLASIIVVALKGLLLQCKDFINLLRLNKYEAINWLGTFLAVVLLDVDWGLLVGCLVSMFLIVLKDQRIELGNMVKYKNQSSYVNNDLIKVNTVVMENVKVLMVEKSLYFANINKFEDELYKLNEIYLFNKKRNSFQKLKAENSAITLNISENTTQIETNAYESTKFIVLDLSGVNYVDTTAIKRLVQMIDDYKKMNISLIFCQCQKTVIQKVNNMDLINSFYHNLYVTVEDAIIEISKNKLIKM